MTRLLASISGSGRLASLIIDCIIDGSATLSATVPAFLLLFLIGPNNSRPLPQLNERVSGLHLLGRKFARLTPR